MTTANTIKKIKVIRTVTVADAVPFHLRNTLKYTSHELETVIVGTDVESLSLQFPAVRFINVNIMRKISLLNDLMALLQLVLIFAKEKPDVTHSIMPKSGLLTAMAAFICRVPARIHTFTGQTWANEHGLKRCFFILLDKMITHLNTNCLTDSKSQSEYLFMHGIRKNQSLLPVLGAGSLSGVDLEVFNLSENNDNLEILRKKLNLTPDCFTYTFVGRKCKDKGTFELIEAFELLTDSHARLILVGPDESGGQLEKRIQNNNKIINCPQTEVPQLYHRLAAVFCLPSYREGFGSTVIEAAALGVPSIGTSIPGLSDSIVDGKTGILVPVKNSLKLSQAMNLLRTDSALLKTMSQTAFLHATKNFDAKMLAQNLIGFYKDQIKNQNKN